MSNVFEVGQKVRYRGEEVTVTYGPYMSALGLTRYLVKDADGAEMPARDYDLTAIPTPPAFAVGDEVTYDVWGAGAVQFGPYTDAGEEVYLVKFANGRTAGIGTRYLKPSPPAVKVGDRVRVTDADGNPDFVGKVGTLTQYHGDDSYLPYHVTFGDGEGYHGDLNGTWNCRAVVPVTDEDTYEHDGVVYDLTAKYRDRDGDTLRIKLVSGVPRVAWFEHTPDEHDDTLTGALAQYGPFTLVTD